jgi:hypothetical protein
LAGAFAGAAAGGRRSGGGAISSGGGVGVVAVADAGVPEAAADAGAGSVTGAAEAAGLALVSGAFVAAVCAGAMITVAGRRRATTARTMTPRTRAPSNPDDRELISFEDDSRACW